jgi:hypothetical protein
VAFNCLPYILNLTENRSTDSKGERWEHRDSEKIKIPRKKEVARARTHTHTHTHTELGNLRGLFSFLEEARIRKQRRKLHYK